MPKCTYSRTTDYGHTMLNPQFFAAQIQIPAPNKYLGFGHEDLVCRNNGLFIYLSNMDKELTVPKWVLVVRQKIPRIPQKTSENVVPKPKKFLKKSSLGVRSPCAVRTDKTFLPLTF